MLFIVIISCIQCLGQNTSEIMDLDIKDYKLKGQKNYDHASEGKTVVQNLLLQCYLNSQMGRPQEFFEELYTLKVEDLKKLGYSFYWPNDINIDFSMREIDEHNSKILKDVIVTYGFPKFQDLTELELNAIFLVLYYSNDIEFINKYKDKFLGFYEDFNFPSKFYAYLTDKLDYISSKLQTYGTFLIVDENGSKQPQIIKDEKQLNSRREKIGLESYEDWKQSKEYKKIGESTRIRESWYRDFYNKTKKAY